jgi:hypothetical protein
VVAIATGASTISRVYDLDLWWHLRTGAWIWEHRAVPKVDPFSYTAPGPWHYTDTLTQLALHGLYSLGGLDTVVLGMAGVVAGFSLAVAWLGVEATQASIPAVALVTALCGMASRFRLGPKSNVFSFLAFAVLFALLARAEQRGRKRVLLFIPPLFLLWGNLHRGGTLGLATLLLVGAVWAWDRRRREWLGPMALTIAASAIALLGNTGGWWYLWTAFAPVQSHARHLGEWSPISLDFLVRVNPAFSLLMLLWAAAWLRQRRWDAESAVAVATLVFAFKSVRMVPFAAVAMVPGVTRLVEVVVQKLATHARTVRPGLLAFAGTCLAVAAVATQFLLTTPPPLWGTGILRWRIPVAAAEFLRRDPPPGRMWNSFNYGGYLLFALPEHKVFVDGRNDMVYPFEFFDLAARALSEPTLLVQQLERYQVGFAVIQCTQLQDSRFAWLHQHPEWRLVYLDDLAAIVVRRGPESAEYLARHEYRQLAPDNAVSRALALGHDRNAPELEQEILRNAREAPESIRALVLQALLSRAHGEQNKYQLAKVAIAALAEERGIELGLP